MQRMDYRNLKPPTNEPWIIKTLVTGIWLVLGTGATCLLALGTGVLAGLFWKAFQWTHGQ